MEDILNNLRFTVFEFTLIPGRTVLFPEFKGNVFRGALGKSLRHLTCVHKDSDSGCSDCMLNDKCIYSRIFESLRKDDGSILGNVENAPHPFVLYIPDKYHLEYSMDTPILFYLTLIGDAIEYIPYFILAFEEIGKRGIGNTRTPFRIDHVKVSGKSIYNPESKKITKDFPVVKGSDFLSVKHSGETLSIEIETPLRLKFEKKFQKHLSFEMIIRNLLRRIQLLSAIHCKGPSRVDFTHLIAASQEVKNLNSHIHWQQMNRFSFRQERTLGMGGISGRLEFEGEFAPFLPYLKIGEYLHLGKGTAFGLGKIKVPGLSPID